jgi:hypothetical protein
MHCETDRTYNKLETPSDLVETCMKNGIIMDKRLNIIYALMLAYLPQE